MTLIEILNKAGSGSAVTTVNVDSEAPMYTKRLIKQQFNHCKTKLEYFSHKVNKVLKQNLVFYSTVQCDKRWICFIQTLELPTGHSSQLSRQRNSACCLVALVNSVMTPRKQFSFACDRSHNTMSRLSLLRRETSNFQCPGTVCSTNTNKSF